MSVLSVSMSASHSFGKAPTSYIYLLPKLGVQGDAHCGKLPSSSNLRQVHLIDSSLFTSISKPSSKSASYHITPGALGENITTSNLDLPSYSEGTRLHFGDEEDHAIVRLSGIRQPRKRLSEFPEGFLERCKSKGRKIGVYAVVEREGYVVPGARVYVESPKTFRALGYV